MQDSTRISSNRRRIAWQLLATVGVSCLLIVARSCVAHRYYLADVFQSVFAGAPAVTDEIGQTIAELEELDLRIRRYWMFRESALPASVDQMLAERYIGAVPTYWPKGRPFKIVNPDDAVSEGSLLYMLLDETQVLKDGESVLVPDCQFALIAIGPEARICGSESVRQFILQQMAAKRKLLFVGGVRGLYTGRPQGESVVDAFVVESVEDALNQN